jgi:DNA-binding MarR family transcriptional regulator
MPMNSSSYGGSNLGMLFKQVRDAMWAQMERELAAAGHDLTFSQYITLKKLADGTASVTDLARAAELNPGGMTRLLDKLEAKRYIARLADPADRRAWHIHLTEDGLKMWQDVNHCGQRVRELAMSGMGDDDRERLITLLTQVRDNLTPTVPDR